MNKLPERKSINTQHNYDKKKLIFYQSSKEHYLTTGRYGTKTKYLPFTYLKSHTVNNEYEIIIKNLTIVL